MSKKFYKAIASIFSTFITISSFACSDSDIKIGTGTIYGLYYPIGASICKLLNNDKSDNKIRCEAEPSGGSIENLHSLIKNDINFSILQSEIQYKAYNNVDIKNIKFKDLRSIFSLQSEAYTLIVNPKSNIKSFADLEHKRINLGSKNSTINLVMSELIKAQGWDIKKSFSKILNLDANEQNDALCANKVDAILFSVGHPNPSIIDVTKDCGGKIISIDGEKINKLLKSKFYLTNIVIPANTYKNNNTDINTIGIKATLVTLKTMSDETVYKIVKTVMENLNSFKNEHPALNDLKKEDMVDVSKYSPIHPGALKYFKEVGLVN